MDQDQPPTLAALADEVRDSPDAWVTEEFRGRLDGLAGPEMVARAAQACASTDWATRLVGVGLLREICHAATDPVPVALAAVAGLLKGESHLLVLEAAASALGVFRSPEGIDALIRLAHHASEDVRFEVAVALPACCGEDDDARVSATLIRLSTDPDDDVRDYATFGLGTLLEVDTPEVREALADRLTDPHPDTRAEAIVGLALRKDPRAIGAVKAELAAGSVGRLAVAAAATLGELRLLDALVELRDWWDIDDRLLELAVNPLRSRSSSDAVPPDGRRGRAGGTSGSHPGRPR